MGNEENKRRERRERREREEIRYAKEKEEEKQEKLRFEERMRMLQDEERELEMDFRANVINEDAYKIKKNNILKRVHELKMENHKFRMLKNIFIPEEIDDEIKFWESIKSCNYSQKSILFDKIINVDDILIQLYKAKQDKKEVKLETFSLSVYYKTIEEIRKEGINSRFSSLFYMFLLQAYKLENERSVLEGEKKKLEEEKRKLEEEKYKNI